MTRTSTCFLFVMLAVGALVAVSSLSVGVPTNPTPNGALVGYGSYSLSSSNGATVCPEALGGVWNAPGNTCVVGGTSYISRVVVVIEQGVVLRVGGFGSFSNFGIITNFGRVVNSGSFSNWVVFDNYGSFVSYPTARFYNDEGAFRNYCGGVVQGPPPSGHPVVEESC